MKKKVFSDEVARELGYQKEYPILIGWVVATVGALIFGFAFVLLLITLVQKFIK